MDFEKNLPDDIREDIKKANLILLREGCREVYIFGSIAEGNYNENSDIDIAIIGLEKKKFFKVYGELMEVLQRSVDLVGLDYGFDFSNRIKKTGKLTRVA